VFFLRISLSNEFIVQPMSIFKDNVVLINSHTTVTYANHWMKLYTAIGVPFCPYDWALSYTKIMYGNWQSSNAIMYSNNEITWQLRSGGHFVLYRDWYVIMTINMYKKSFTDFFSKRWLMSQTPPLTEQRRPGRYKEWFTGSITVSATERRLHWIRIFT